MSRLSDSKDMAVSKEHDTGVQLVMDLEDEERGGQTEKDEKLGTYRRTFTSRHIQMISLAGGFGSGIFINTGRNLRQGGPIGLVMGYLISMTGIFAVMQTLTEMTCPFPVSGSFVDYADRFVDPALGFAIGFAEWLAYTTVVGGEGAAISTIVKYWTDVVPVAAWMAIMCIIVSVILCFPNRIYAEFAYGTALIKLVTLTVFLLTCCVMIAGGGPTGTKHTGETWRELPVLLNGFTGFSLCSLAALWAVGDQAWFGIMGGETAFPRYAMPRATKGVVIRAVFIYFLTTLFVTLLVPSNDERLWGGSGVNQSPFVIALSDAGIQVLPHILNAVMCIGICAFAVEAVYLSSRILRSMAYQGLIWERIGRVDSKGRPLWSIGITMAVAAIFAFINCSNTGIVIFTWFSSVSSAAYMSVWLMISISNFRFRAAVKAQGDGLFSEPWAYKAAGAPFGALWLGILAVLYQVMLFYVAIVPIDNAPFSAYNFFQYILGLPLIAGSFIGYKVFYRTKIRKLEEIDLKSGRRTLSPQEIEQLEVYHAKTTFQKFMTYVRVE